MSSKRWLVIGIVAACASASWMSACGNDSFTSSSNDDASTSETSTDGALLDSPTITADAAAFCQPAPTLILCADFDETDPRTALTINGFGAFFVNSATSDGGSLFRSDSGLSPPNALTTSIPAIGVDASAQSQTAGTLDDQASVDRFRLSFDMRFDAVGDLSGDGTIELATFGLSAAATTTYQIIVHGGHVAIAIVADGIAVAGIDLGAVPVAPDKWLPFSADITLGPTGKVVASLGSETGAAGSFVAFTERRPELVLGAYSPGATGALAVSFDNVLLYADQVDAGVTMSPTDSGLHD